MSDYKNVTLTDGIISSSTGNVVTPSALVVTGALGTVVASGIHIDEVTPGNGRILSTNSNDAAPGTYTFAVCGSAAGVYSNVLKLTGPAVNGTNSFELLAGATTVAPTFSLVGDTNVSANLLSKGTGGWGINTAVPTARLHLPAGTATASTAPLKLTSGTNLTTAEAGAMEYNGTNLFFTRAGTVREGVLTQTAITTEVVVSDTTVTVNIGGVTYKLLAIA